MEAYTDFAYLYDTFMEDVPYEEWADFLESLIKAYGENVKSIVDLGCGTGTISNIMSKKGYDVTGVDYSTDMLSVAMDKAYEEDAHVMYINQDMRSLKLINKADVIYSLCDSINYMILDKDINSAFKSVYNNLSQDGLFIFDFNTIYKYETVIGDTTIAENREDCSFIWENYYNSENHINEYEVTFFEKIEGENPDEELFRRFTEEHIQRGYNLDEMKKFLEKNRFRFIAALDEKTHKEPASDSERIYIIARK